MNSIEIGLSCKPERLNGSSNMRRALSFLILSTILSTGVFAHNDWVGEFSFDEDGGETAGGSKIFVSHTLDIKSRPDGSYSAKLLSQGFQTSNDILGEAKVDENVLSIFFKSKGEDHNGAEFKKDELLFRIYTYEGNYFTIWDSFKPTLDASLEQAKIRFTPSEKALQDRKDIRWARINFPKANFAITVPDNFIYQKGVTKVQLGVLSALTPGFSVNVVTEPGKDPGYASYLLRENPGEELRFGKTWVLKSSFSRSERPVRNIIIFDKDRYTKISFSSRDRKVLESVDSLVEVQGKRLGEPIVTATSQIDGKKLKSSKAVKEFKEVDRTMDMSKVKFIKTETHECPFDNSVSRSPSKLYSPKMGLKTEELPERTVTVCFDLAPNGFASNIVVKSMGPVQKSLAIAKKLLEGARIVPAIKDGKYVSAPVKLSYAGTLG